MVGTNFFVKSVARFFVKSVFIYVSNEDQNHIYRTYKYNSDTVQL
jgi:hypothetical protein